METVTYQDAARELMVSNATLIRWVKDGKLSEGEKVSRQKTVTRESLDNWKSSNTYKVWLENKVKAKNRESNIDLELEKIRARIDKQDKIILTIQNYLEELRKDAEELRIILNNSGKEKSTSQKEKNLESESEIERKAQFILAVSERTNKIFSGKIPNPFGNRKLDKTCGNITSLLKAGKRPASRINKAYQRILEINQETGIFRDMESLEIDQDAVERWKDSH